MVERFEIALNTPAGRLTTALDVPTGFVPITAIVPVTRRLGEEAMQLEEQHARELIGDADKAMVETRYEEARRVYGEIRDK